jgi:hypothetical protein
VAKWPRPGVPVVDARLAGVGRSGDPADVMDARVLESREAGRVVGPGGLGLRDHRRRAVIGQDGLDAGLQLERRPALREGGGDPLNPRAGDLGQPLRLEALKDVALQQLVNDGDRDTRGLGRSDAQSEAVRPDAGQNRLERGPDLGCAPLAL